MRITLRKQDEHRSFVLMAINHLLDFNLRYWTGAGRHRIWKIRTGCWLSVYQGTWEKSLQRLERQKECYTTGRAVGTAFSLTSVRSYGLFYGLTLMDVAVVARSDFGRSKGSA